MYLTIINDCSDPGTANRQIVRASTLFPQATPSFVEVSSFADIEASGLIIDTLDAALGAPGIILVNVAPRHGKAKKWENGTPFGHLKVGQTDIFTTVDGLTLSLLSKYALTDSVEVYDLPTVMDHVISEGLVAQSTRDFVTRTQFRSYEFLPRVARWYQDGVSLPFDKQPLSHFDVAPLAIWYIDNFGNCKTSCWASDIGHVPGQTINTKFGPLVCYDRLKDVPSGEPGLTIGSSGYGEHRFVELVVQGSSGAKYFDAKVGDHLL